MNRYRCLGLIPMICLSVSACMAPSLRSLESFSDKNRETWLQMLHISDLCHYYLDPEIQGSIEQAIASLLQDRGVTSCSDKSGTKMVLGTSL